jgi:hypothetical protein
MRSLVAAVMAGGIMLAGASSALAQEQEIRDDGMDCVYLALSEEYELVAEVFLYDDVADEDVNKVNQLVETAKKGCAERYKLSEGQLFTISELAVYASSIDYLGEELLWSGSTEAAVEGVLDVYQGLNDEEYDLMFDTTWRSNAALYEKLKSAVVAKGIPSDDDSVNYALTMIEISAMADEAMMLFELDDLLSEEEEKS